MAPLWQFCMEGNVPWVMSTLCLARARGEDINCKDQDDVTGLMWALLKKHNSIVRLLLEQPTVDLNCTDNCGDTALHYAVYEDNIEAVQLLLADPRLTTVNHKKLNPADLLYVCVHPPLPSIINSKRKRSQN